MKHVWMNLAISSVFMYGVFSSNIGIRNLALPKASPTNRRDRRQDNLEYDYAESPGVYDTPGYSNNPLQPIAVVGSAGLALKALKVKSVLKMLKIPVGLALMGGVAALAAGLLPPAVIGGINLPFQGKRKKRSIYLRRQVMNLERAQQRLQNSFKNEDHPL